MPVADWIRAPLWRMELHTTLHSQCVCRFAPCVHFSQFHWLILIINVLWFVRVSVFVMSSFENCTIWSHRHRPAARCTSCRSRSNVCKNEIGRILKDKGGKTSRDVVGNNAHIKLTEKELKLINTESDTRYKQILRDRVGQCFSSPSGSGSILALLFRQR